MKRPHHWAMPGSAAQALSHLWHSWRSVRGRELACAVLVALYLGTENLGPMLDFAPTPNRWTALALSIGQLLLQALVFLLCWLPADRSEAEHPRRSQRLMLASLLGAAASALILRFLLPLVLPLLLDVNAGQSACSVCSLSDRWLSKSWLNLLGEAVNVLVAGGLLVAVFEMLSRRRRADAALQRLLDEQSRYARDAMAARLLAKQAQVDPQGLFKALLGVEQAYAAGDAQAPAQMDALIAQLRAAMGGRL